MGGRRCPVQPRQPQQHPRHGLRAHGQGERQRHGRPHRALCVGQAGARGGPGAAEGEDGRGDVGGRAGGDQGLAGDDAGLGEASESDIR